MISRGFTLVELMVVIVIIFIMAAIALPGLGGFARKKCLEMQCNEITSLFYRARESAMEQDMPWRVVFSPERPGYLSYGDANANSSLDQGEHCLGPYSLPEGVSFFRAVLVPRSAVSGSFETSLLTTGASASMSRINFSNWSGYRLWGPSERA